MGSILQNQIRLAPEIGWLVCAMGGTRHGPPPVAPTYLYCLLANSTSDATECATDAFFFAHPNVSVCRSCVWVFLIHPIAA